MRTLIEALLAFLIAIFVPMGTCEAVFKMGIRSGEIICGHNAWIQIFFLLVMGFVVVAIRFVGRRKLDNEVNPKK